MPLVSFAGGEDGTWRVDRLDAVTGASLPAVRRVDVIEQPLAAVYELAAQSGDWILRGVTSNERYSSREEHHHLAAQQSTLGRQAATCAALIPITKSEEWWKLSQDERRELFEERSHHIAIGQNYLPAIARRLHHGHDLGEPFDFLTWFEYEPREADAFEDLVARLRATPEWEFVVREVDIRLTRSQD